MARRASNHHGSRQRGGGVYGDNKKQMQKENKWRKRKLKGAQDEESQWET